MPALFSPLRELTVVIVTAVYIPPDANASAVLSLLLNAINEHQRAHPDGDYSWRL